jgi:hypothetical protein
MVDTALSGHPFRRLREVAVTLLGSFLVFAGLMSSAITILLLVVIITGNPGHTGRSGSLLSLLLFGAAGAGGLLVGRWIVRGRRRLVLFLRRFGFDDARQLLTFAVATALGRKWRLVTLDDSGTDPVGTSPGPKWWSRAGIGTGLAVAAWGLYWVLGPGAKGMLENLFSNSARGPHGEGLGQAFGRIVGAFMLTLIIGGFVLVSVILLALFSGATAAFSWFTLASIRKAERARAWRVMNAGELTSTVQEIANLSRRIFAPRLTVVKVSSRLWQRFVSQLSTSSSVVIIDVSEPSENLLWEIENLAPQAQARWVFIGRKDRVVQLAGAAPRVGDDATVDQRLAGLLDGREVLAYSIAQQSDMRRFSRALQERLEREG